MATHFTEMGGDSLAALRACLLLSQTMTVENDNEKNTTKKTKNTTTSFAGEALGVFSPLEASARWKMVSSLVSTSKSFTMTDKHKKMFKSTTKKFKTSKQLLADRHDEVNRYLMLDDVGMLPPPPPSLTSRPTTQREAHVAAAAAAAAVAYERTVAQKKQEQITARIRRQSTMETAALTSIFL